MNLGSKLESVHLYENNAAFSLRFTHGDTCLENPSQRYSTSIDYFCQETNEPHQQWPMYRHPR